MIFLFRINIVRCNPLIKLWPKSGRNVWVPLNISAPCPSAFIHILLWPICAAQLPEWCLQNFFPHFLFLISKQNWHCIFSDSGMEDVCPKWPMWCFSSSCSPDHSVCEFSGAKCHCIVPGMGEQDSNMFFRLGSSKMGDLYEEAKIFWS